ncbi:hypothetical protein NEHOM01_1727 [Nematocida homosporus]|uniref:uncharacterized protein n=1 Tax=Nematocida homosporus TaxID=1912981 RepID=UPI00221FB9FA|nr:uncharacterized protein NEHOM01_1727 [Nematocida homosporus]KAI5186826.1 hypothetical protein NEHOM01_1727 [Nematocida homosporus]
MDPSINTSLSQLSPEARLGYQTQLKQTLEKIKGEHSPTHHYLIDAITKLMTQYLVPDHRCSNITEKISQVIGASTIQKDDGTKYIDNEKAFTGLYKYLSANPILPVSDQPIPNIKRLLETISVLIDIQNEINRTHSLINMHIQNQTPTHFPDPKVKAEVAVISAILDNNVQDLAQPANIRIKTLEGMTIQRWFPKLVELQQAEPDPTQQLALFIYICRLQKAYKYIQTTNFNFPHAASKIDPGQLISPYLQEFSACLTQHNIPRDVKWQTEELQLRRQLSTEPTSWAHSFFNDPTQRYRLEKGAAPALSLNDFIRANSIITPTRIRLGGDLGQTPTPNEIDVAANNQNFPVNPSAFLKAKSDMAPDASGKIPIADVTMTFLSRNKADNQPIVVYNIDHSQSFDLKISVEEDLDDPDYKHRKTLFETLIYHTKALIFFCGVIIAAILLFMAWLDIAHGTKLMIWLVEVCNFPPMVTSFIMVAFVTSVINPLIAWILYYSVVQNNPIFKRHQKLFTSHRFAFMFMALLTLSFFNEWYLMSLVDAFIISLAALSAIVAFIISMYLVRRLVWMCRTRFRGYTDQFKISQQAGPHYTRYQVNADWLLGCFYVLMLLLIIVIVTLGGYYTVTYRHLYSTFLTAKEQLPIEANRAAIAKIAYDNVLKATQKGA